MTIEEDRFKAIMADGGSRPELNTGGLLLDSPDAKPLTLRELKLAPEPKKLGRVHKPIHHYDFVVLLLACIRAFGLELLGLDLGVRGLRAEQLFGVARVGAGSVKRLQGLIKPEEATFSLGFRGANDCTMSRWISAAKHMMICSNMMMTGQILLKKRQTLRLDMEGELMAGLHEFVDHTLALEAVHNRAKETGVSDEAAKAFFWDLLTSGKKPVLPQRLAPVLHRNYFEPQDDWTDCHPRTYDGVLAAATRAARGLKPEPKFRASRGITTVLAEHLASPWSTPTVLRPTEVFQSALTLNGNN